MTTQAPTRVAAWLVLLVAITTLPSIATRELMPTDEPRFALVARQMVEDPAPVVPHLGYDALTRAGERYADKPPVFFWLVSLFSFATGGVNEISARIPSLLAAIAVVLMTWRMGRLLFDDATGALGAALLATASQFFLRAAWCSIDMTLTAFTTAAALCWLTAARTPRHGPAAEAAPGIATASSTGPSRTLRFAALGGLFAAAATLSKGPVGVIFPLTLLAADRISARLTRGGSGGPGRDAIPGGGTIAGAPAESAIRAARMWMRPALAALAAFLAPVGLWVASIWAIAGSPYVVEILFKQNVTRYVAAWNNIAPWYYYFGRLPVGLLPWVLLLPGALLASRGVSRERAAAGRGLLLACAALFIFFSASTGKRGVYLLPLYPALSLLLAAGWRRASDTRPPESALPLRPYRALAAVHVWGFLVACLALPLALPLLASRRAPEVVLPAAFLGTIAAVAGIAGAVLFFKTKQPDAALAAHVAGVAALIGAGSFFLVPVANRAAGVRDFGASLAALSRPDDFLVVDQEGFEQILFYVHLRGARRDLNETKLAIEDGALVMEARGGRRSHARGRRGAPDRTPDPAGTDAGAEPSVNAGVDAGTDPAASVEPPAPPGAARVPADGSRRASRRSSFARELERAHHRVVYPAGARVVFVVAGPRADRLRRQLGPASRTLLAAQLYGKPYFVIASR